MIRANRIEVGDLVTMPVDVAPTVELSQQQKPLGRPVVLFFFLGLSGKWVEVAKSFGDLYEEFTKTEATVLGVIATNLEKLSPFAKEHALPFPLLADTQLKLHLAFGAARPDKIEANKAEVSLGARTIVLDANQRVFRIYDEIDPATHAATVLEDVQRLVNRDAPRVTRFEDFRIACYDASRGGYFRPHRDNTTEGTAHRRFAMSLLLSDDYEGGSLRFPEYGPHTYRPAAGAAVIFSCSLLHEGTDVTAGKRFVLLSFFYGEAERKLRDEYERKKAATAP